MRRGRRRSLGEYKRSRSVRQALNMMRMPGYDRTAWDARYGMPAYRAVFRAKKYRRNG